MKILVFGETNEAVAIRDAERGNGNEAFLRNPDAWDSSCDTKCGKVYTDNEAIAEQFKALGVEVAGIVAVELICDAVPDDEKRPDGTPCETYTEAEARDHIEKPAKKRK